MGEYIIVSTAVTDDIIEAKNDYIGSYLGGAGIYALAGISMWTDNAMLVTGVGEDFYKHHAYWFRSNKLSMDGIYEAAPLTPRTNVYYFSDGRRIETPCFGAEHYLKMEPTAETILQHCTNAKGVYIFKEANPDFWGKIIKGKKELGFALEWEINADSARFQHINSVKSIAEYCDIFSINLSEACSLMSVSTLDEAIKSFSDWSVPMIFLRNGSSGSIVIREGSVVSVPSIPDIQVTDPTGAGNASSAAVLYGYCEGYSDYDCGLLGNISATQAISQYGPPANIEQSRQESMRMLIHNRNII